MPEDVIQLPPEPPPIVEGVQIAESSSEPPAFPPVPPEPLDERGVPYKNRIAEYERKLSEQQALNQQYQQVLGQYMQPQPAAPAAKPDVRQKFDAETLEFVRSVADEIAEQKARQFILRQQVQEQLADVDVVNEARPIYARLRTGAWATMPDELVQERALSEARLNLELKRAKAAQTAQTQQQMSQANRAPAAAASLPPTMGGTATPTQDTQFVRDFLASPERRKQFRQFYPQLDLNSAEGQQKFRKIALNAQEEQKRYA